MKRIVKGILYFVIILAIAVLIVAKLMSPKAGIVEERQEQSNVIQASEVIKSFKISSLTYRYTNIMYDKSAKYIGKFKVPWSQKHLGVSYDGVMEIGIDGSRIEVSQDESVITIRLPQVEILAHTPVNDSMQILFDINTIFVKNDVSDFVELFNSQQKEMERKVVEMGLLEQACASAQEQLAGFLKAIPEIRDNYSVVFEQ